MKKRGRFATAPLVIISSLENRRLVFAFVLAGDFLAGVRVHNLQGEWKGMAQIDYTQIFDDEVPVMRARVGEILNGLANELRRIAQTFEEVDQQVV